MLMVQKRDGQLVDFSQIKITYAIQKAFRASKEVENIDEAASSISKRVATRLVHSDALNPEKEIIDIEDIQNAVEVELMLSMYTATAKAFIIYRQKRADARDMAAENFTKYIDEYFADSAWDIKENSNMSRSLQGLNNFLTTKISKKYWLDRVLSSDMKHAHVDGDLHIHDLNLLSSYTYGNTETVVVKLADNTIRILPISMVFDICSEDEVALHDAVEVGILAKYPKDLLVLDKSGWTKVTRVLRKNVIRDMLYLETKSGHSNLVTDNHPIITATTNLVAENVILGTHKELICNSLDQTKDELLFSKKNFNASLGYSLGYLINSLDVDSYKDTEEFIVDCKRSDILVKVLDGLSFLSEFKGYQVDTKTNKIILQDTQNFPMLKESIGYIESRKVKVVPADILMYNKAFIKGFLEGTVDRPTEIVKDFISIGSTSRTYIEQIAFLFRLLNFNCTIVPHFGAEKLFNLILRKYTSKNLDSIYYNELIYDQIPVIKEHNGDWSVLVDKFKFPYTDRYIYDLTTETHTLIVNGLWCHNCSGWDLRDLLMVGFESVADSNSSGPANHFDTILGQIPNFLYTLQGEAAGAQALSNFDTYLAPFIRYDNLTLKEVKQSLQKFFHNMTTKTRVGFQCVPDSYQCLTEVGWKYYHELVLGENIYTFNFATQRYELHTLLKVNLFSKPEQMYDLVSVVDGTVLMSVSADHDVVYKKDGIWFKHPAKFLSTRDCTISIPVEENIGTDYEDQEFSDEFVEVTVQNNVATEGYDCIWCPSTLAGNFVCMTDKFSVVITGNCPFTNVSMDLYVPKHMRDEAVIIGGKLMDATYKEFQPEMDMFNKAFCEVMIAGDSKGRQFSFPIPNYSITKEFDWENPSLEPLWTLTGKYGAPYFTNFVNSDLDPSDIRSMCPIHPSELIRVKMNNTWFNMQIIDLYKNLAHKRDFNNVYVKFLDNEIPVTKVVQLTARDFISIVTELSPDGFKLEIDHVQPYLISKKSKELGTLTAGSIKPGYFIPYSESVLRTKSKPKNSFVQNGVLWVPVLDTKFLGRTHQYAYCIEVDSDLHLFEMHPEGVVTHNCRLRLDNRVLRKRGGGLFGANPLTGSIGVVTINLPRLGYLYKGNRELFFEKLEELMIMSAKILSDKRKFIEDKMDEGLYPYMRAYMRSIKERMGEYFFNHFSTIGVIGGHECCLNFMGKSIVDPEGKQFVIDILDFMLEKILGFQEKYGYPFNLESSPAEGTAYRLAKVDVEKYPDIITAITNSDNCTDPYYTNSTNVPVDYTSDIFKVCQHQSDLQIKYTGGTVLHCLLGEEVSNPSVIKELVKTICTNSQLPYITISPKYSVCKSHGHLRGEVPICPTCKEDTEVYSRIVGWYSCTNKWNKGKLSEYKMRKDYDVGSVVNEDGTPKVRS